MDSKLFNLTLISLCLVGIALYTQHKAPVIERAKHTTVFSRSVAADSREVLKLRSDDVKPINIRPCNDKKAYILALQNLTLTRNDKDETMITVDFLPISDGTIKIIYYEEHEDGKGVFYSAEHTTMNFKANEKFEHTRDFEYVTYDISDSFSYEIEYSDEDSKVLGCVQFDFVFS